LLPEEREGMQVCWPQTSLLLRERDVMPWAINITQNNGGTGKEMGELLCAVVFLKLAVLVIQQF